MQLASISNSTLRSDDSASLPAIHSRTYAGECQSCPPVLSGLLASQAPAVEKGYEAQGLVALARKERDGWIRVELSRG